MKPDQIMQIFHDTAYIRMGGTQEELRTAEYLRPVSYTHLRAHET